MIAEHLSNNSFQHDPVYDIHSRRYINDLVQVLILYKLFKNAEDAMSATKAIAKIVLFTNVSIGSIRKYPNKINIPNEFYNLVEAFYYSILREREGLDDKYPLSQFDRTRDQKQSKERVTIALCCNASGTEKAKAVFIGK
ncbi:2489_t:CDS:2, partial [Funneliformis caledonium]